MTDDLDKFLEGGDLEAELVFLRKDARRRDLVEQKRVGLHAKLCNEVRETLKGFETPEIPPRPALSRKKRKEIAVVHLSDWQWAAKTEDFNQEVARQRLEDQLLPKVRKIIAMRRHAASVDECHVFLGGDLVDGSALRANQSWDVEAHVMHQALRGVAPCAVRIILALMDIFPRVRVVSVPGNHGRVGKKGGPDPDSINWDTVAAIGAEMMLGDAVDGKRLTFHVEEGWHSIISVGKSNVLLIHGDEFPGGGGIAGVPVTGITARMLKWADSLPPWDTMLLGHFHSPSSGTLSEGRRWFLNGTLLTNSEWAIRWIGHASRASQRLLIFDEERGVIADHVLWLN